jgi:hypothetical protein
MNCNDKKICSVLTSVLKTLNNKDTISKKRLFELCGGEKSLEIELYKFKTLLTEVINSGKIKGYKIKTGRNGGVCRNYTLHQLNLELSSDEIKWLDDYLSGLSQHPIAKQIISKLKNKSYFK